MPTPDPHFDQLLRTAIQQTRLLQLRYRNKDRIVEPHDYGEHNGAIKLLTYQGRRFKQRPASQLALDGNEPYLRRRTIRSDVSRWPPDGFRQTSQMGQALPQGQ